MRIVFFSWALLLATLVGRGRYDRMTVLLDWFVNPDHGPLIIAERTAISEAGQRLRLSRLQILPHRQLVAAGWRNWPSATMQLHFQIARIAPTSVQPGRNSAKLSSCP